MSSIIYDGVATTLIWICKLSCTNRMFDILGKWAKVDGPISAMYHKRTPKFECYVVNYA